MNTQTLLKHKLALIIFGIFVSVVMIEVGMRFAGAVRVIANDINNKRAIKSKGDYRILCLGESTTFLGWNYSYPAQLERILNAKDTGVKFSVINGGVVGTNTTNILKALEDNLQKYSPDLIITMMGVNDGRPDVMPANVPDVYKKSVANFFRKFKFYQLIRHIGLHLRARNDTHKNIDVEQLDEDMNEEDIEDMKLRAKYGPEILGFIEQADEYIDELKFEEAKDAIDGILTKDPDNAEAYMMLGNIYSHNGDHQKAITYYDKALEADPTNTDTYVSVITNYYFMSQYEEAEKYALKMLGHIPESQEAYENLARIYFMQKNNDKLEEIFDRADKHFPHNYLISKIRASYLLTHDDYRKAERMFDRADDLGVRYTTNGTIRNYLKMKEIILDKGIKMICAQYPLRSVGPLKKMLVPHDGVVFVDNEAIFKKSVKEHNYHDYFVDNFAGDFGHLTPKGNELLAENIANVILRKFF